MIKITFSLFLKWIAKNYAETSDRIVTIKDNGDHDQYINKRYSMCWEHLPSTPDCQITLGFLQAATAFISNGKQMHIRQITSVQSGDQSCDFVISEKPMD